MNPHSPISHTEVANKRGTTIRVGQQWCDNSPTRDPIRHFTIESIEETYGTTRPSAGSPTAPPAPPAIGCRSIGW